MSGVETAPEVAVATIWKPGIYVLWGDVEDADYASKRGTVIEHFVAVGRGDAGEDLPTYKIARESDGYEVSVHASEVYPAFKEGLDVIPDMNGEPVRVGDFVRYKRAGANEYGGVRVTEVKPQTYFEERYRTRSAKDERLDLRYSSVSIMGYGSGQDTFTMQMMEHINLRGDWSSGMSRNSESGRGDLVKIEVSEEEFLRAEVNAMRRHVSALDQAINILMRRRGEGADDLNELRAKLGRITGVTADE